MISKEHRFYGNKAIKHVLARGTYIKGESFSVKFVKKDQTLPYRLAIAVSTKVQKSAVARNRIRRRIYEGVREGAIHFSRSYDIVIIVHDENLKSMPSEKLKMILLKTISRIEAII